MSLAVLRAHRGDLHGHAGLQAGGQAGADLEAEQAAAEQRVLDVVVRHDLGHDVHHGLGEAVGRRADPDLRGAVLAEGGGHVLRHVLADEDGVAPPAEVGGQRAPSETAPREFLLISPS
jgi:hypothetical protein